jgi:hypothetical protein
VLAGVGLKREKTKIQISEKKLMSYRVTLSGGIELKFTLKGSLQVWEEEEATLVVAWQTGWCSEEHLYVERKRKEKEEEEEEAFISPYTSTLVRAAAATPQAALQQNFPRGARRRRRRPK